MKNVILSNVVAKNLCLRDPSPLSADQDDRNGFTLIELLVVLAIVVVIAGLSTALFVRSFRARSAEHYIKELTAYLRYVQCQSIEDGRTRKWVFDEQEGGFRTLAQKGAPGNFVPAEDGYARRFHTEQRFIPHLARGSELYFFPDGTISRNMLRVTSETGDLATIEIKNRIGAFKVSYNE